MDAKTFRPLAFPWTATFPAGSNDLYAGVVVPQGHTNVYMDHGMLLLDYFAGQALPGVLYMAAHGAHGPDNSPEGCAAEAYKLGEAMLAERAKRVNGASK